MTAAVWVLTSLLPLAVSAALAVAGLAPEPRARAARAWLTRRAPLAVVPTAVLAALEPDGAVGLPWLLLGTTARVDEVAQPLLLLAALVYGVALVAVDRTGVERAPALTGLLLLCYVGNVGVLVAADAVTFYLSFTVMSFVGYGLVIHDRTEAARRAGRIYLVMTVLGEAAVLVGLLLVVHSGGLLVSQAPSAVAASANRDLIVLLLLAGLGVKAGAVPMHVWLPLAHPAAPTPASAVLSGVMIKAGLVGWLRFLPLGEDTWPGWGQVVVVLALLGAFLAVPVGVLQREPKAVLAYSSISHMGFLSVLVGMALAVPETARTSVLVAALYAVHHGAAKAALFLGIPLWKAHGGGRHRWLLLTGLGVTSLAVAGAPLTGGYVAKYASKDVVSEATVLGLDLSAWLPLVGTGSTLLLARAGWVLLRGPAQSRRADPLVWWWLLLIVLGGVLTATFAVRWYPSVGLPGLLDAEVWWDQSWPPLLGAALAVAGWVASRRGVLPRWAAHPDGRTVPPGDVVVVEERALRRARGAAQRATHDLARLRGRLVLPPGAVQRPARPVQRSESFLQGWQGSGVVLLVLLAGLLSAAFLAGPR